MGGLSCAARRRSNSPADGAPRAPAANPGHAQAHLVPRQASSHPDATLPGGYRAQVKAAVLPRRARRPKAAASSPPRPGAFPPRSTRYQLWIRPGLPARHCGLAGQRRVHLPFAGPRTLRQRGGAAARRRARRWQEASTPGRSSTPVHPAAEAWCGSTPGLLRQPARNWPVLRGALLPGAVGDGRTASR